MAASGNMVVRNNIHVSDWLELVKIYVLLLPENSFWNTESEYTNMSTVYQERGKEWSSKAACSQKACQTMSWAGLSTGRCSEKLLSCLIFFFVCLNIESLCSLSHCDVKSPVGNVFSEQLGLWLYIPLYSTSLTLASYLSLICTCFIFGTRHKNTVLCQGLNQLYLWVWPRPKK